MSLVVDAVPAFLLLLIVEVVSYRFLPPDDELGQGRSIGFAKVDTATNVGMGLGNLAVQAVWGLGLIGVYAGLYSLTPFRLSSHAWSTWVLLVILDDLCYYAFHRAHHEIRLFWASHVVHHSSDRYNLSTAVRQTWTPMTGLPFWLVLPLLGFKPWMVVLEQSVSLIYQFGVHTERIDRLGPLEWIFNTPSHHRVHHGSDQAYLDKNYGGILIIWDRIFGTFQTERARPTYGLTKPLQTNTLWRVAFHEYAAIGRDVRSAARWRDRAGYVVRHPGWSPQPQLAGSEAVTPALRTA